MDRERGGGKERERERAREKEREREGESTMIIFSTIRHLSHTSSPNVLMISCVVFFLR